MNRIAFGQNQLWQRFQILTKSRFFVKRNFSSDSEEEIRAEEERRMNARKGISSDKERAREESYFHKEELEQLKSLKQKMKSEKARQQDKDENK